MSRTRVFARDAGLDLIGRMTRWLVAGAVGVMGGISLYASHAFRPQRPAATALTLSSPASSPTSTSPSSAQTGASGLAPAPAPPVAAAPSTAPVVSGGS